MVGRLVQELQGVGPGGCIEGAVDMAGLHGWRVVVVGELGIAGGDVADAALELLRGFDEVAERDRPAHGSLVVGRELVLVGLRECPEAADHAALLINREALSVGEVADPDVGREGPRAP